MAVYKQTYRDYSGPRTAAWSRCLILTRYSFSRLFQSRFLVLFMAVCLFYPIGCAAFIYLTHCSPLLAMVNPRPGTLPAIDGRFFYVYCTVQGALAFLLTALVGPSLVAPDLANGAMPLYLSRPFSRAEYVAGKMAVAVFLLSLITWIPGLILYLIQASCAGWEWTRANLWLAGSILLGLWVWIVVVCLIALALSAWVKWKIAAGASLLGVFFAGAGFGAAVNSVMRTHYGSLMDLTAMVHTIWSDLFRYDSGEEVSVTQAWIVLAATCVLCVGLLARRVRAFEVVR